MSLFTWSRTAASNTTADSTINAREGQAPSTVNDAMRSMMAAAAKYRDDMSGNVATGGSSTAYTLTTYQVLTALTTGLEIGFTPHATNGVTATINVDSLGAKPLRTHTGVAIKAGALVLGTPYRATYNLAADEWRVHGQAGIRDGFAATTSTIFTQATAPVGWTKKVVNDNAALRLVSGGTGGSAGGTANFTTAFAARTIARADLPNDSIVSGGTAPVATVSGGTIGGTGNVALAAGGSTVPLGAVAIAVAIASHTHTVALNGGVTQTAMDFAVKYLDAIDCEKDA